jgi:hypothetical protein
MNRAEMELLELARLTDTRPRLLCPLGCRTPTDPQGLAWDHAEGGQL